MASLKNRKADLRARYKLHLEISLIITLALILAAFKLSPDSSHIIGQNENTPDIIKVDQIFSTIQKPEIPPPPKQPAIIEASIDDITDDYMPDNVEIFDNVPVGPPPPPLRPEIKDETYILDWSEVMPAPIGGLAAIQSKVKYTDIDRRAGLEGRVIIVAVIDEKGNATEAEVLVKLGGGLDESALKAVMETKFSPGMQRGKPVKVRMKIPVKFVLR